MQVDISFILIFIFSIFWAHMMHVRGWSLGGALLRGFIPAMAISGMGLLAEIKLYGEPYSWFFGN